MLIASEQVGKKDRMLQPKTLLAATVAIIVILIAYPVHSQRLLRVDADWRCTFDGSPPQTSVYTFSSDKQARDAVAKIVNYTGLVQNFTVTAASVENAEAFIEGQERVILYNQQFMLRLINQSKTDWAATGVMAHEIGHHLQGHTVRRGGSNPESELEADKFAGFILQRMGASLDDSLAGWRQLGSDAPSLTHPPRKARLDAVTNGWIASRDLAPIAKAPQVLPPVPTKTDRDEIWFVTMSKAPSQSPQSQQYRTLDTLPHSAVEEDWNKGYQITKIASGDKRWVVLMAKGTGFTSQRYSVTDAFPEDLIKKSWDEGFRITSLAAGNGKWAMVLSKGSSYTGQSYQITTDFPTAYFLAEVKKGFMISAVAAEDGKYAVVMSEGTGLTSQTYYSGDDKIPAEWVKEKWGEGFYVTNIVHRDQWWTVIMSKGTGYTDQFYWLTKDFPRDWIQEQWAKGFVISNLY
jgi:hypothetical protein